MTTSSWRGKGKTGRKTGIRHARDLKSSVFKRRALASAVRLAFAVSAGTFVFSPTDAAAQQLNNCPNITTNDSVPANGNLNAVLCSIDAPGSLTIDNNGILTNFINTSTGTLNNNNILLNNGIVLNVGALTNALTGKLTNNHNINNTGTLSNAGILTNNGGLTNFATGTLINDGMLINNYGAQVFSYGVLKGTGKFNNSGALAVGSGGNVAIAFSDNLSAGGTLSGGSWTVSAALGVVSTLSVGSGAIAALGANTIVSLNGADSQFAQIEGLTSNAGYFAITNGRNLTLLAPNFANSGALNLGSYGASTTVSVQAGNTLANIGNVSVGAVGTLSNAGTLNNSGTLYAADGGLIRNEASGTLNNTYRVFNRGSLLNAGTLNNNSGGPQAFLYNSIGGSLTNTGVLNNNSGAQLINQGTISNSGIFNNNSGAILRNGNLFNPAKTFC